MTSNPVLLISGTRQGIGRELVRYYANKKFEIVGCSRNDIDFEYDNYYHFNLDVSDELAVKRMFSDIRKKYGRLDILINNAGVASKNHVLLTSKSEVNNVLNTNFIGTFLFCREAAKLMKIKKFGRIVNISTIHIPLAFEGTSVYGASKAAIEQFTKVFSKEVFQYGISVNTLSLSVVKGTGMEKALTDEVIQQILNQTHSKSIINFRDISNATDFLISSESRMVVNQTLCLGGI